MPVAKALEVLSIQADTFSSEACEQALQRALRDHCLDLTGSEDRDVQRFETELADDGLYVLGYSGEVRRLFFHLDLDRAPSEVGVELRATKGELDVLKADWGSEGPLIGNSILIARLLHVGICTLRSQGVEALVNEPYNSRLEARYASMGFEGGRRLSLLEPDALARAFRFIGTIYDRFGVDLRAPPP